MKHPLTHHLERLAADRWASQGVRSILRALWMGGCIWCLALGGHIVWGWPLRLELLGSLSLGLLVLALLRLLRRRLGPAEAARRLERRFRLHEQLSTAVEVAASNPAPGSIPARLVEQAAQTSGWLRAELLRRQRFPWNDLLTLLAVSMVALGLLAMLGIGQPSLPEAGLPLPPLPAAENPGEQSSPEQSAAGGQQPGQGEQSAETAGEPAGSGDPRVMDELAEALRDQGATRPAAEALDRGDLDGAASELRELADQAGQLSQGARSELAGSLRDAANDIEQHDQQLAEQLRRSADGLEQGGREAAEALDDLARAVEQLGQPDSEVAESQPGASEQQPQDTPAGTGQQPGEGQTGAGQSGEGQPGGAGAGDQPAGEQRQSGPSDRLGVAGQPVELETRGESTTSASPSDRSPTTTRSGRGFTEGGRSAGGPVDMGADPLRVPLDERDVVQEYFTP